MDPYEIKMPAENVNESARFYLALGFKQNLDHLDRVSMGCRLNDSALTMNLVQSTQVMPRKVVYLETDEFKNLVSDLKGKGFQFTKEQVDEPWLWDEARMLDPSHNEICFYQTRDEARMPPWRLN